MKPKYTPFTLNPSNAEATLIQSRRTQRFLKPYKPCHVDIHWLALDDYSQMSTLVPGFQSFSVMFIAIFCVGKINHQQYKGWPFQCWGYFRPKHKDAKIFDNHLNMVVLVFIEKLSLSTLRWVPMCQSFSLFQSCLLQYSVLAKLSTSSIRVKNSCCVTFSPPHRNAFHFMNGDRQHQVPHPGHENSPGKLDRGWSQITHYSRLIASLLLQMHFGEAQRICLP